MSHGKRWSVYKTGPGSGAPYFTGSKTECLRFLAYVMANEEPRTYSVVPA